MRRALVPLLLPVLLVLSGCVSSRPANNACANNGAAPIVCIDANGNANPDPVHVKRGQWLHFFAASGDLSIEEDFLESSGHDGPQAWGRVRQDATLGRHKYTVILNGKRNDPEVMIDP